MSASHFASFAAYTPPPDDFSQPSSSNPPRSSNIWSHPPEASYQSGAVPAFYNQYNVLSLRGQEALQVRWETRYGWRVDLLAFFAYLLGPFSALVLLISETQNDCVRFHAYQSALITTPLVFIRIVLSLLQFSPWLRTLFTCSVLLVQLSMSIYAYRDAAQSNILPFHAPFVGDIADKWLADE